MRFLSRCPPKFARRIIWLPRFMQWKISICRKASPHWTALRAGLPLTSFLRRRSRRGCSAARGCARMRSGMRDADPSPFYAALPFAPTGAQRRTIAEIAGDLCAGMGEDAPRMSRIVVGDVGSGKTVCAAAALFFAVRSGAQAAMLAPTEILAEQHYATLSMLFAPFGFVCGKLTGGMTAAAKRRVKEALADGTIQIVVGTHALLRKTCVFHSLAS